MAKMKKLYEESTKNLLKNNMKVLTETNNKMNGNFLENNLLLFYYMRTPSGIFAVKLNFIMHISQKNVSLARLRVT